MFTWHLLSFHYIYIQVNCETDFVSKNEEFHKFVRDITEATFNNCNTKGIGKNQILHVTASSISQMGLEVTNNPGTITDLVIKHIGHFGENITVSRGCFVTVGSSTLSSFVYNNKTIHSSDIVLGTYGSLVLLQCVKEGKMDVESLQQFGLKVGQHIVGMNPSLVRKTNENTTTNEEALVDQPYLLDPNMTVDDWLKSHDLQVIDFVRYELGEQLNV